MVLSSGLQDLLIRVFQLQPHDGLRVHQERRLLHGQRLLQRHGVSLPMLGRGMHVSSRRAASSRRRFRQPERTTNSRTPTTLCDAGSTRKLRPLPTCVSRCVRNQQSMVQMSKLLSQGGVQLTASRSPR